MCHRPTSEDVVDGAGENPDRSLVIGPDRAATSSKSSCDDDLIERLVYDRGWLRRRRDQPPAAASRPPRGSLCNANARVRPSRPQNFKERLAARPRTRDTLFPETIREALRRHLAASWLPQNAGCVRHRVHRLDTAAWSRPGSFTTSGRSRVLDCSRCSKTRSGRTLP